MLCDDERFRAWIDQQKWPADVRRHADEVWGREEKPNKWFGVFVCHECMTSSRRHFDHDPEAAKRWDFMHARYRRETGLDPEPRG